MNLTPIARAGRFRRRLLVLAGLGLASLTVRGAEAARSFHFPATGVAVTGEAKLLAIDDYLLPLRENLGLYLSKPVCRTAAVVRPSRDNPLAPDQVAAHFYGGVVYHEGRYQMWYYAVAMKEPGDADHANVKGLLQGPVCYAESADGITWTKPDLGQVEVRGSRHNNAIALPDALIEGVHVVRDESDPDPQRRYKMVYNPSNGKTWVIRTATSPDGIHWQAAPDYGIDQFLETASLYHFNGLWVVNGQRITVSEGGHPSGRQGRAVISPDFARWLPGDTEAFLLPEPPNPADRGPRKPYDQVHLGVGAASFGTVAVGLYGQWHNQPGDEDSQKRWGWFGYGKISCDLGLVVSNDGLHFREPAKGHAYISRLDAPATPIAGHAYPTILTQSGNGILNVGDETRIYFGRWLNADYDMGYSGEVGLAILPRDRWGALGLQPPIDNHFEAKPTGSVWTAAVRLPAGGCRVVLNADHARKFTIEVADENFTPLPDMSGAQAGRLDRDGGLDCAVTWPAGSPLALGGRTVRFKINVARDGAAEPRLYAVYLRAE
ncbi:MAG TPA: hypothetical protein PLB90_04360 [Opitutaceae bacterium]|nr:hypothetical protein [Opitutaceae bacterium]